MFSISFFKLAAFFTSLIFFNTAWADDLNGLYNVKGMDSRLGSFSGEAQIRGHQTIRKIIFNETYFASKKIELIWVGEVRDKHFAFTLTPSQTLTSAATSPGEHDESLQAQRRSYIVGQQDRQTLAADLETLQRVDFSKGNDQLYIQYTLPDSTGQEVWVKNNSDPGPEPLWQSERYLVSATSHKTQFLVRLANWLGIQNVIEAYQAWTSATPWSMRKEYKENQQWAIYDPTDYAFYQAHPNVLRITNKTINNLSLIESLNKRNAYGQSLFEKAKILERETINYNLNSAGILEVAGLDANLKKIHSELDRDAALWTGVLAWTQSLKFVQTRDPESLEILRRALSGLIALVNISPHPGEFARTLLQSKAGEQAVGENLVQGQGEFVDLKWQQGGNNDMIKGIFLGLIAAQSVLPEDDLLRPQMAQIAKKLLNLKVVKSRGFNLGIAWGLNALYTNDPYALNQFVSHLENITTLIADAFDADSGFYYEAIADWSGVHLSTMSTLCQLLLAQELENIYKDSTLKHKISRVRKNAENRLFEMSETYKVARRDFLTIIANTYSPEARNSIEHRARTQKSLWALREFPAPRFVATATVDHQQRDDWALSRWPSLPWKVLHGPLRVKSNPQFANRMQGAYMYPLYESLSWGSKYIWRENPFRIQDASPENKVFFSVDYLMLYHVAIQGKLIGADD